MTSAFVLERSEAWTEDRFFALGETNAVVELFDGSLLVSPAPTVRHQQLSLRLAMALFDAAEVAGLEVNQAVNVRLQPGRIPIPDLVVNRRVKDGARLMEARDIALICEITSTNAATDRVLKMHYYATARIPWYLLVDPDPVILALYRLEGGHYVEHALAKPGEILTLTEPVAADLDPASLTRRSQ
jgi:Uma2 family endonuclease